MIKETFGEKIKRVREERGLSCSELAKRSNVSAISIHAYEKGHSVPTISTVRKIAKVLEMSLADFEDCSFPEDGREKSTKNN